MNDLITHFELIALFSLLQKTFQIFLNLWQARGEGVTTPSSSHPFPLTSPFLSCLFRGLIYLSGGCICNVDRDAWEYMRKKRSDIKVELPRRMATHS
jgi:hypothetical protein